MEILLKRSLPSTMKLGIFYLFTNVPLCSRNFQNVKLRPTKDLREINFGKIRLSKIAIFTTLETLNFKFWLFGTWKFAQFY